MSVEFNTAQSVAEQYRLPPPPDPQVDPAGYDQWLQGNAAYVAEPAYHPQFGQLFAANDPQAPVPASSFADEVRGQQPQTGIDHDLALLSEDV